MGVSPARRSAFDILMKVETEAAFSTDALHSSLLDPLTERDRALVSEIVLGGLRRQGEIDHFLTQATQREMDKLDPEVRVALRMGCYQMWFLDRIPARAAVSESVEIVKHAGKRSAAGLVNAVLRKLPDHPVSSADSSNPTWITERWRRIYGPEITASILGANLKSPPTYLRLNARYPLEETLAQLAAEGVETEATELRWCRAVRGGRPRATKCYREGRIRIQDISSQTVTPLLDLEARHRFLDLCAAPGGKTCQALEQRGSWGQAVAADLHLHRLRTMRTLATVPLNLVSLDAETPLPFRRTFDRLLVDVPCSGTGTLARNPEIKWRLTPEDLDELSRKQQRILRNALAALRPGGVLVYATCSLEPEENQAVVEAVLETETVFRSGAYLQRVPGRDAGDGFFACRLERQ